MTNTKHTPGPWRLEADPCHFDSLTTITGGQRMNEKPHAWPAYQLTVQVGGMASVMEAQANARRIIACVNACDGFSIEEIEGANLFKDSIESDNLIDELQAQRDEMLSLLTEVAGNFTRDDDLPDNLLQRIDAAIDKVERN